MFEIKKQRHITEQTNSQSMMFINGQMMTQKLETRCYMLGDTKVKDFTDLFIKFGQHPLIKTDPTLLQQYVDTKQQDKTYYFIFYLLADVSGNIIPEGIKLAKQWPRINGNNAERHTFVFELEEEINVNKS